MFNALIYLHDPLGKVKVEVSSTPTPDRPIELRVTEEHDVIAWITDDEARQVQKALKRARKAVRNGKRR